ncbi:MAG: hypothetical protein M3362_18400 [Acidobacteriota bacterium]|nr:hypothetical protein [Acidobacteriota bacterium]
MRKTFRACVLVLVLCAPAFAGDILNPSKPQPPPPPQSAITEERPGTTAEEQATDGNTQDKTADRLTETVVRLLERVLAMF